MQDPHTSRPPWQPWLLFWLAAIALDYAVAGWATAVPKEHWSLWRQQSVAAAHTLGQGWMVVVLGVMAYVGGRALGSASWRSAGHWFVGIVLLTGFWAQGIKHVIGRPRPRQWAQLGAWMPIGPTFQASWDSFPSGHAMTVFATAPLLAALLPKWRAPIFSLAVAIALGRVLGADHYLSDVVFGSWCGLHIGAYVTGRWRAEVEAEHVV